MSSFKQFIAWTTCAVIWNANAKIFLILKMAENNYPMSRFMGEYALLIKKAAS